MQFVTSSFILLATICGLAAGAMQPLHHPHRQYLHKVQHHKSSGTSGSGSSHESYSGGFGSSYSSSANALVKHIESPKSGHDNHKYHGDPIVLQHYYVHEFAADQKSEAKPEKQESEKHSFEAYHEHHHDIHHDYHAHPKYKFEYGVKDEKSGDDKNHWEERDGDKVKGNMPWRPQKVLKNFI